MLSWQRWCGDVFGVGNDGGGSNAKVSGVDFQLLQQHTVLFNALAVLHRDTVDPSSTVLW